MKFDDIEWHDQILTEINIDRSDPGKIDSIEIRLVINGEKAIIEFINVYHAQLNMNFGIVAEESIRYGAVELESDELLNIKEKWQKISANLDNLKCYIFNTNSTNSIIKIYALNYSFEFIK